MAEGKRGFASMDPERQKRIASQGGKAAHAKGSAHEFTADEARNAGRKGGLAVSQNREHMSTIGREGGKSRGRNVARRLAEQRAAQDTARTEGQIDQIDAGERIESEQRSEGAFMGGPAHSERSHHDVEQGEIQGEGVAGGCDESGGFGGPDRGE